MAERNLDDWISGFMSLTENSEPPTLYRKWCAVSAISSALQRKVKLELGLSLTVYANFYIVLIGPSATGKGTAMKFVQDILDKIPNIRQASNATSLQALIRRMKDVNLTDIDKVTGKQTYHSSITVFSNEFTVFLGYHNKEMITALCDWYDCHSRWSYDTIKRDKEEIVGVWVNILGGSTPDSIQASFPVEAIGGGLTSRIIFVNEEKRGKLVIFPSATPAELALQEMLVRDLEQINLMVGDFHYSKEAMAFYADWCLTQDSDPPFSDRKFDGYIGRRRRHLNSISMICSASRSDEMIIRITDIQRAAEMLAEVEVKMGTVFRGIGKSDVSSILNDAITFLQNSSTSDVPLWMFARRFEGDIDKLMLDRVLQTLEAMKYIVVIKKNQADSVIHIIDHDPKAKVDSKIKQTNASEA